MTDATISVAPLTVMQSLNEKPVENKVIEHKDKPKSNAGRPTVMTDETLGKLRTAFLMGCNDELACAYAEICPDALYDYQRLNPQYTEQKRQWKSNPILKALNTVFKSLDDKETSKWYLERKLKKEFAPRQEITGDEGERIQVEIVEHKEQHDE